MDLSYHYIVEQGRDSNFFILPSFLYKSWAGDSMSSYQYLPPRSNRQYKKYANMLPVKNHDFLNLMFAVHLRPDLSPLSMDTNRK